MEKTTHTLVRYTDLDGRERTKKTNQFGPRTHSVDITEWISSRWEKTCKIDIEIKDPDSGFVDFDDRYNAQYNPFDISKSTQASSSNSLVVELRIIEIRGKISELIIIISLVY
jgi:hypothetical protein